MPKRNNEDKFLMIPHFILFNNELDAVDKLIVADIHSLSKLPKGCYKSQNGFGSFLNITRSAISKRLESLESTGFINSKKYRPELRNSRKNYTLIIDRFENKKVIDDKNISNSITVDQVTSIVPLANTNSSPENNKLVPTGNTISSPDDIYYNNMNTIEKISILDQDNIVENITKQPVSNSGMSMAQFARMQINDLEDKIIKACNNGYQIVQNANFKTIKQLYDYVDNRNEYELVLPLLKNLVSLKKNLHG